MTRDRVIAVLCALVGVAALVVSPVSDAEGAVVLTRADGFLICGVWLLLAVTLWRGA